jgi:4-amino-4-deoxy-L-arabinose transferase-like glycosyltransferase
MSMEWDEVTHFTGGLLLSRGQVGQWIWTNSFYPPAFDTVTAVYYLIGGVGVFAGRLVAVTFSILSIFVVYAIANRLYNAKTALIAAVLFGVMPGIVWLSRMAMIETFLIFMFSLSMLFFFSWLRTNRERDRIISVAALAVSVAVKYQMLVVVPIIMLLGMWFWKKDYLKSEAIRCLKFPLLAILVAALAAVVAVGLALLFSGLINRLLFAIQVGTADKAVYSIRYPMPVFYFMEMAWSNNAIHPISLLLYFTGLAGLGLFVFRRRLEDKFLLLWFAVVYVVFTLIPNREWRYVTIAFPVLAIAAASLLDTAYNKISKVVQTAKSPLTRKLGTKLAAVFLIAFTATGLFYSCADAYTWVSQDQIQVPIEQATDFAAQGLSPDQMLLVACPLNRFNKDMVWFYLNDKAPRPNQNQTLQYPKFAADAYTPNFNTSELVSLCQQYNVKDVMLYEYEAKHYFNSTLTAQEVNGLLLGTGRFTFEASFGAEPNRIFVFSFR